MSRSLERKNPQGLPQFVSAGNQACCVGPWFNLHRVRCTNYMLPALDWDDTIIECGKYLEVSRGFISKGNIFLISFLNLIYSFGSIVTYP